jgi:hypothetical protein
VKAKAKKQEQNVKKNGSDVGVWMVQAAKQAGNGRHDRVTIISNYSRRKSTSTLLPPSIFCPQTSQHLHITLTHTTVAEELYQIRRKPNFRKIDRRIYRR